jgi:hypothetical protein
LGVKEEEVRKNVREGYEKIAKEDVAVALQLHVVVTPPHTRR